MRRTLPLILPIFIFLPLLLYLHQKVQIYVEAYRLSNNYRHYNDLIDQKDCLLYDFAKEVSLARVNQWAQAQDFTLIDKERVFALNTEKQEPVANNKIALLLERFLRASTSTSVAMAGEKR